jgi:hypothetical protein
LTRLFSGCLVDQIKLDAKGIMLLALAVVTVMYLVVVVRGMAAMRRDGMRTGRWVDAAPTPARIVLGFITNFFDTLGIGSFATTTSMFRFFRMVPDELIPGTLNVGHTLGAITQTFIYTRLVPVEATTLISMIVAAVAGSWLGAGVVSGWPRPRIQWGMGVSLMGFAVLLLLSQTGLLPGGGTALGVTGAKLAIAVVGNFALGALMTLGIGLYAPCLVLVSLLGMDPIAGFPIMMGSCAGLYPRRLLREVAPADCGQVAGDRRRRVHGVESDHGGAARTSDKSDGLTDCYSCRRASIGSMRAAPP